MVRAMWRPTKETFTIVDETGRRYTMGQLVWKTIDTVGRTLLVLGLLMVIGLTWEFFH